MFNLEGKVALITGATGGIGEAITKALFASGATVVLTGRREDALNKIKAGLGDDSRVFTIAKSLDSEESANELVKETLEVAGSVDILINNAGITKDGLAMRMSSNDWDAVLDVNLKMPFLLSKAVIKPMMKKRNGRIINMSSIVGTIGNPGQCNYSASKGGMVAMSKSLSVEVAPRGITVNCIAPGFIATPMTDALSDEQKASLVKNIPTGTLGTPEDIAAAVVYLASDEAKYVTGQTIHVNGGMARI